jgi:predicted small lipoprotein YifL
MSLGDLMCYPTPSGQWSVLLPFTRSILLLLLAVVAGSGLSACGRNGALELPAAAASIQPDSAGLGAAPPPAAVFPAAGAPVESAAAPAAPQDTIAKTGFDAQGNPAATPGQKKPFLLDPLLR